MKTRGGPPFFYGWVVIGAVAVLLFGASGARFSFGVFYKPMLEEFGWERAQLALAISINFLLTGLLRPFVGGLVDRYGGRLIGNLGIVLSALVLLGISFINQLWHAYLLFALLAVGYSMASTVSYTPLISRWFVRRRGLAFSVASVGTALGELTVMPLAQYILVLTTWQTAYQGLVVLLLLAILPVGALLVRNSPQEMGVLPDGDGLPDPGRSRGSSDVAASLGQALRTPAFWQLSFGFFVCGFTMSFALNHFIAFATDMGFESMTAATALGMVGGVSIVGSLIMGVLSDRFGRKGALALVYLLRGAAFVVLAQVTSVPFLYFATFVLGLSWVSNVPLTQAITADRYGLPFLGSIFGTMFMLMPFGSAVGAYLSGLIFDLQGSYQLALWINGGAGLLAAIVVSLVAEERARVGKEAVVTAVAGGPSGAAR